MLVGDGGVDEILVPGRVLRSARRSPRLPRPCFLGLRIFWACLRSNARIALASIGVALADQDQELAADRDEMLERLGHGGRDLRVSRAVERVDRGLHGVEGLMERFDPGVGELLDPFGEILGQIEERLLQTRRS